MLVEKLAEKHLTILGFIEEYLLDPVHGSQVTAPTEDAVTPISASDPRAAYRDHVDGKWRLPFLDERAVRRFHQA